MQNDVLEKNLRTAKIIAGAMMVSILIYVLAAEFLADRIGDINLPEFPILRIALYTISGIEIVVIAALRRLLLNRREKLPGAVLAVLRRRYQNPESTAGDQEINFSQRLLSTSIITFAISESIAIYGLVLFILGKQRQDLYLLAGISLLLIIFYFPQYIRWKERLEQFLRDSSASSIS